MTTSTTTAAPAGIGDDELAALADPDSYLAPEHDCDLIMKGGITSGVVYPLTACRLATRYRLRRLGGASAGAIAATFAAAAELGRRRPVDPEAPPAAAPGFVGLQTLPDEMGRNLAHLFQPTPALSTPFRLLTTWTEPGWGTLRRVAQSVALIIGRAPWLFVSITLLALLPPFAVTAALIQGPTGVDWARLLRVLLVFLPGASIVGLLASVVWVLLRTNRQLPAHGFGLCNGHTRATGYSHPPLTDWMTSRLNTLADRPADGPPLTFADLWGPDATAVYWDLRAREKARNGGVRPRPPRVTPEDWRKFEPRIDVLVMTTALTLGRPYQFPFNAKIFFFCPSCLAEYFPGPVVAQLVSKSGDVADEAEEPARVCPDHGERVRSLPEAPDLPLVLAARLSLSFPLLISAVPLFTVDWNRARGKRGLIKVWFSDGGIASNFPMHFFDSAWPERPTFGINLADEHPDHPGMVWRPRNGASGIVPRGHTIESLPQFLGAMINCMQNWADNTQLTLPGFRDRVVEVRTSPDEGGINLKMRPEAIGLLSRRGAEAAAALEDFDLELHRWIRYRVSMGAFTEVFDDLEAAYGDVGQSTSFGSWLKDYAPSSYRLAGRKADRAATALLVAAAKAWREAGYPALNDQTPHPLPQLRQTPAL